MVSPSHLKPTAASAIVITLAFVVLATVVIVALFTHVKSTLQISSSAPIRAESDILVRSAIEATISDFRMEMLAGAESMTDFTALSPMTIRRHWAMAPARSVSPNLPAAGYENLAKQSLNATAFYPGSSPSATFAANGPAKAAGTARASAINTATPSGNGRLISSSRWDLPVLASGTFPSNALPDWIYVTRGGIAESGSITVSADLSKTAISNTNTITGRYAYNVYNVGGLLDINSAGYPRAYATQAEQKGSLAWADLSAVGLSNDVIASLVNFRNAQTQSSYPGAVHYQSELGGFLAPLKSGNSSDGFFYTRQDMLRFFLSQFGVTKISALSDPQRASLSSFTEGSRFLAAPSWQPDSARATIVSLSSGGNKAYGTDNTVNPSITSLKVLSGKEFTRLRFSDPGTYTSPHTVQAKAGEPLVNSRFALDRLQMVSGTSGASADAIQQYFGLTLSSDKGHWTYNHTSSTSILTLNQVQAIPREPDMAELLKAAILAGSLGKTSGTNTLGGTSAYNRDTNIDYQVIQILANLIDQTKANNFPTEIQFDSRSFYGAQNLPYIARVRAFLARCLPDTTPLASNQPYTLVFLPEVWNPNAPNVGAVNGANNTPDQFRVVADTTGISYWVKAGPTSLDKQVTQSFDPADNNLIFSSSLACTEPVMLKNSTQATPSLTIPGVDSGLVGIRSNDTFTLTFTATSSVFGYALASPGITFGIEYHKPTDAAGVWHRYAERNVGNTAQGNSPTRGTTKSAGGRSGSAYYSEQENSTYFAIDPRTDRFSSFRIQEAVTNNGTLQTGAWQDSEVIRPDLGSGHGVGSGQSQEPNSALGWTRGQASLTTSPSTFGALATILQNTSSSATRYTDADGTLRPGDGGLANGSGVEGQMYLSGNTPSRPIILHRPFRSVAEMGYAFRDTPGRSLDFFSANSGDASLLDYFSVHEVPDNGLTSGRISANGPNYKVYQALLNNALIDEATGTTLDASGSRATTVAQALTTLTASSDGPLLNRRELVTRLMPALSIAGDSERIKRQREVYVRALADSLETRTWNFLIDLIVQTGRLPQGSGSLSNFRVNSERHVWVHLAMDRITGKVLNLSLEPVYE
ncbi:MAG: hypothetical protein ACFUZC_07740 [Chthoniobacteraceae bacterium]